MRKPSPTLRLSQVVAVFGLVFLLAGIALDRLGGEGLPLFCAGGMIVYVAGQIARRDRRDK